MEEHPLDAALTTTAARTEPDEVAAVSCETTAGDIVMEFHRHWSPAGYDRAVALFEQGFYDHSHFFRTVPNFLVQFGISYSTDAALQALAKTKIADDPQLVPPVPFTPGTISYAGNGPNSRTSNLFIALQEGGGNFGSELWETPVGKVVEGLDHVRNFYGGYGDMPPWGKGPLQGKIHAEGAAYMNQNFPKTERFVECKVHRDRGHHAQTLPPHRGHVIHEPQQRHHQHNVRNAQAGSHRSHRSMKQHQLHQEGGEGEQQHVTGELHHQHLVHFNAAPNEEGLTKLSWELLSSCLVLFLGVFALWLRFALNSPKKSRKTS